MPLHVVDDSFSSLQQEKAEFDFDDSDLSQLAFAMEVDEGAHHCSILCYRTCDPVATPHSSFDMRQAATKSPAELSLEKASLHVHAATKSSAEISLGDSPHVHAPYPELLQVQAGETQCKVCLDGVDQDFRIAKCGLLRGPDAGRMRQDANKKPLAMRLPRANVLLPPRSASVESVLLPTNVDISVKGVSYRVALL